MLEQFRDFTMNRLEMDDLIALATFGRQLKSEYATQNVPVPEWVTDNLNTLNREIKSRNADRIQSELRSKRAMLAGLKTTAEKRSEVENEIAELEKQASAV